MYPWITWELVTDPLESAWHTLGTTAVGNQKRGQKINYAKRYERQSKLDACTLHFYSCSKTNTVCLERGCALKITKGMQVSPYGGQFKQFIRQPRNSPPLKEHAGSLQRSRALPWATRMKNTYSHTAALTGSAVLFTICVLVFQVISTSVFSHDIKIHFSDIQGSPHILHLYSDFTANHGIKSRGQIWAPNQ